MTKKKPPIKNPVLKSWDKLNDYLRDCTQTGAERLLDEEKKGRARAGFMKRIHSRINKVRAERERNELVKAAS